MSKISEFKNGCIQEFPLQIGVFPFGIAFALLDRSYYLIDLLNGGNQEPYTNYCGFNEYTNQYNCFSKIEQYI